MLRRMTLRHYGAAALALALTAAAAPVPLMGQPPADAPTLRTIGIVEIPRLFNRFSPDGTPLPPDAPIEITVRPETRSGVVALAAHSSPARVVVHAVQPGWFEVSLESEPARSPNRVWLQASPLWRFVPAADEAEARS